LTPHVLPFKVTQGHGTNTDQSAIYDFPLTFHSNYFISEINGNFSRKPQTLPTPSVFNAPGEGFPLELHTSACGQKNRMGLPH